MTAFAVGAEVWTKTVLVVPTNACRLEIVAARAVSALARAVASDVIAAVFELTVAVNEVIDAASAVSAVVRAVVSVVTAAAIAPEATSVSTQELPSQRRSLFPLAVSIQRSPTAVAAGVVLWMNVRFFVLVVALTVEIEVERAESAVARVVCSVVIAAVFAPVVAVSVVTEDVKAVFWPASVVTCVVSEATLPLSVSIWDCSPAMSPPTLPLLLPPEEEELHESEPTQWPSTRPGMMLPVQQFVDSDIPGSIRVTPPSRRTRDR